MSETRRSTREIERDVEQKRAEMQDTLNEIGDRLSPEAAVDYGMNYMRGPGGRRILGAARDNPLALVLMLAGAGWLFYTASQPEEERRLRRERSRARYAVPARLDDRYPPDRDPFPHDESAYTPTPSPATASRSDISTPASTAPAGATMPSMASGVSASRTADTIGSGTASGLSGGSGSSTTRAETEASALRKSDIGPALGMAAPASPSATKADAPTGPKPGTAEPPFGGAEKDKPLADRPLGSSTASGTKTSGLGTAGTGSSSSDWSSTGAKESSMGSKDETKADAPGPAFRNDKSS